MSRRQNPLNISFLEIDIRLVAPTVGIILTTIFVLLSPYFCVVFIAILGFCYFKFVKYRSLILVTCIIILLQVTNIWVRNIPVFFIKEPTSWVAVIEEQPNRANEYIITVQPESAPIFQAKTKAKLKTESPLHFSPGDTLQFQAPIQNNKFGFTFKNPTKVKRIDQASHILIAQERIKTGLTEHSDPTSVGLFLGMTYGDDSAIAQTDKENFRATGITHLTAVSGSNIALVSLCSFKILALLSGRRPVALIGAIILTFLYCLFVGLEGSVIRAFFFALIGFLVSIGGSTRSTFALACSSIIALVLVQPLVLWDVGFVLSASITLGIILVCPALNFLLSLRLGELMGAFLSINLVAHLFSLPISAIYFGKIYTFSLIANFLIGPIAPVILFVGLAYLLFYFLYDIEVTFLYQCVHPILRLIAYISKQLAQLDGSVLEVHNSIVLGFLVLIPLFVSCIIVRAGRREAAKVPEPHILI